MLKVLAKEKKVVSKIVYVGKKKKEVFSITKIGRVEFKGWLESLTGEEVPRNEFLLKLFFVTDPSEMMRLFQEQLEKVTKRYEEYKGIEQRLENLPESSYKTMRLKGLKYGMTLLKSEIDWLGNQ